MAQTEITVQVFEDLKDIEKKLVKLGFVKTEEFDGRDDYFVNMDKGKIAKAGYGELLKDSLIVRSYTTLTSKNPTSMLLRKIKTLDENQNVIGEEKVSTKIDNVENARKLLSGINLINWVSLKQKNAFYKNGEKTIIVGGVEGLGNFIEIEEYKSISTLPEKEKFEILKQYVNSFKFKIGADYSCKKVYMLHTQNLKNLSREK